MTSKKTSNKSKKRNYTKRKSKKQTQRENIFIFGLILILLSLIVVLHETTGILGSFLWQCSRFVFGDFYYLFYIILSVIGLFLVVYRKVPVIPKTIITGLSLLLLVFLTILAIPEDHTIVGKAAFDIFINKASGVFYGTDSAEGGIIGITIYFLLSAVVSYVGTLVVLVIVTIAAIILIVGNDALETAITGIKNSVVNWYHDIKEGVSNRNANKPQASQIKTTNKKENKKSVFDKVLNNNNEEKKEEVQQITLPIEEEKPLESKTSHTKTTKTQDAKQTTPNKTSEEVKVSAGTTRKSTYKKPNITMCLDNVKQTYGKENDKNAKAKADQLLAILNQFDVPCTLQDISIGPSVTKFEVKPEPGIRVSKITSLQNNIMMELAVSEVRIEAPVPGKNAVGIEIPNVDRSNVQMKEMMDNIPDKYKDNPLTTVLGKDLSGNRIYCELNKMPHLLIAGSTGSGKSVCINSIICSILLNTTPDEVKLLLIDPKKVEFAAFEDVPHLIGPVISDTSQAANSLKTIVQIMDERFNLFSTTKVKSITEYNKKFSDNKMYYIVVIIDELADLMLTNGKDVEANIQRITQLARAAGIHLIVATQRPSTNVITGTIKANIPSRISFAVSNSIDSRVILDQTGAEHLLGNGDMLYLPMGENATTRIQGVYVSDNEIARITEAVKAQGKPSYNDAFVVSENGEVQYAGNTNLDPLYDEVRKFVITTKKASTSSIQRYFSFGYNRAARIIDALEEEGVIGPSNGSKPREVYWTIEDLELNTQAIKEDQEIQSSLQKPIENFDSIVVDEEISYVEEDNDDFTNAMKDYELLKNNKHNSDK